MAIDWKKCKNNSHVQIGVDWNAVDSSTSVSTDIHVYRWDEFETYNDGSKRRFTLNPDPNDGNSSHTWGWVNFVNSSFDSKGKWISSKQQSDFAARTYKKGHSSYKVSFKVEWDSLFGTAYNYAFHQLGAGSNTYTLTIPALAKYTISYNLMGGKGNFPSHYKWCGEKTTCWNRTPTKEGYKFLGWDVTWDNKGKSPHYYPGGGIAYDGNQTLYALWERIKYSITFDANGGTVNGSAKQTVSTYHGDAISIPTPVKKNYKFLGWNTAKDGSGTYLTSNTKASKNITYYAIWELAANCYVKVQGAYKPGMMYVKTQGVYKTGTVSCKYNGSYKPTTL